jgi:hypothetical protein
MGRTVAELERSMSAVEFQQWVAFNEIDPFTSDRDDLRAAITAHAAAASNGASCKVSDFVPDFNRQPVEQSEDDIRAAAMKITRLMGGSVSK